VGLRCSNVAQFLLLSWCAAVLSPAHAPNQFKNHQGVAVEALKQGADALFILLGGIMVLAMHAGFAFLELGTVRKKNQVNALVKILVDFSVSTVFCRG
jgi:Ammonium Transporter Family